MQFGPYFSSVNDLVLDPVKQIVDSLDYQFPAPGKCYDSAHAQKPKKYHTQESHNAFPLFYYKFHSSILLFVFFAERKEPLWAPSSGLTFCPAGFAALRLNLSVLGLTMCRSL